MAAFLAGAQESRRLVNSSSSSSSIASSGQHNQHHHSHLAATRTPSTCSQVSELDEDELEEDERRCVVNALEPAIGSYLPGCGKASRQVSSVNLRAKHQEGSSLVSRQSQQPAPIRRCFRHLLQSIPVPLAATSIITIIILCLLLSECKSLQLSSDNGEKVADDSSRQMGHHTAAAAAALEMAPDPISIPIPSSEMTTNTQVSLDSSRILDQERELLRRELIGELVGFQQFQQQQQQQQQQQRQTKKQHIPMNKRQHSANFEGGQQQVAPLDTLGALLMSAGVGAGADDKQPVDAQQSRQQEELLAEREDLDAERYLDGALEESLESRPAHLRSSQLALELPASPAQQLGVSGGNGKHPHQQQVKLHQHQNTNKQRNTQHQKSNKAREAAMVAAQLAAQEELRARQANPPESPQSLSYNHERPFDVAQIQCNNTDEGFERFACPSADIYGRYRCIEDRLFCDGYYDCPGGEDEDRVSCMYYKLFVSHIDILTNTFLSWMKKQNRQSAHRLDIGVA